jgi:hypothetical protein
MEGRVTIGADDVEAIARRIAQLVGQSSRLVDAQSVAAALDVERERVHYPSRVTAATPNRGHERRKAPVTGAFRGAAEGTRTLDLLHGKQTL